MQSAAAAKAVRKGLESKGGVAEAPAVLQGLRVPEPAFFCTIEPATAAQQAGTVYVCVFVCLCVCLCMRACVSIH